MNRAVYDLCRFISHNATIYPSTVLESVDGHSSDANFEASSMLNLPVPVRGIDPLPLYALDAEAAKLYRAVRRRRFGQKGISVQVIRSIFRTSRDYIWPSEMNELVDGM